MGGRSDEGNCGWEGLRGGVMGGKSGEGELWVGGLITSLEEMCNDTWRT